MKQQEMTRKLWIKKIQRIPNLTSNFASLSKSISFKHSIYIHWVYGMQTYLDIDGKMYFVFEE